MRHPLPVRVLLVAILAILPLSSCSCRKKTDAELAAEERAKVEKRLRSCLSLFPYRAFKACLRSKGQPGRPEVFDRLEQAVAATEAGVLSAAPDQPKPAAAFSELAIALYRSRETLKDVDEDDFPTLWAASHPPGTPPPFAGYDAGMEHASFALIWMALDLSGRSGPLPAREVVFYELARAKEGPNWPLPVRAAVRLGRGAAFAAAKFHYAAEEELTGYLALVGSPEPILPVNLAGSTLESERLRALMLGIGHVARAWNRMGLDRGEGAVDDLDVGIEHLAHAGGENELVLWGRAFVHAKRGRYEKAAEALDRLADSPHLEETAKQEVRVSAASLRSKGTDPVIFAKYRAMGDLIAALLARAGGLERVLVAALGEEKGKQAYRPVAWLHGARVGFQQAAEGGSLSEWAKDLGEEGLALGKRGVEHVKAMIGGGEAK